MDDVLSALALLGVSEWLLKSHGLEELRLTSSLAAPAIGHRRLRY